MLKRADELKDKEFLYRRISDQYYKIDDPFPAPVAFRPRKDDINGLSLFRANYLPLHKAAISPTQPTKHYYVARLRVGSLRNLGMCLQIDVDDRSHILITNLNYLNYKETQQREWLVKIAQEICEIIDPSKFGVYCKILDCVGCWIRSVMHKGNSPWSKKLRD